LLGVKQFMDWPQIDWQTLKRLRAEFLQGRTSHSDYWQSESDLASYDATFAQRIGWKWDYVLAELSRRGWSPPPGEVLDWGCGSGIAGRAFLDHFDADLSRTLRVWDRSMLAMNFAAQRARERHPELTVNTGLVESPAILLLSHVLTELTPEQTVALEAFAATAQCVLWVEPGTREASLALIAVRERLRAKLNLIAPCPHQERCGLLAAGNERHWCHHFASPPPGVFLDGQWARFANVMGIDLRDLPLSFLVLDQRPTPVPPAGATRIIGHPRLYKPHALLLSCDQAGVGERKLTKRTLPDEFKRWKKGAGDPLQIMKCAGEQVVSTQPFPSLTARND
jgi:hypothetical protein